MKNELIVQASTVDAALEKASKELGVEIGSLEYVVLEEAKKGFLGIGGTPAKVKVTYALKPIDAAAKFINTLISDLELNAEAKIEETGDGEATVTICGEDAGSLIGHHGDTLDAFQYLVNLAANKKDDDERKYTRISVDIENYRENREVALSELAEKIAARVKKTKRSFTLEPMNAYERRIIHASIQKIEGVTTNSIGEEGNRKVVVYLEGSPKPTEKKYNEKRQNNRSNKKNNEKKEEKPQSTVTYRHGDASKPPRKVEKAKDLDSYFEKLKEFGSSIQ